MAVFHFTMTDDDVFAGYGPLATVVVTAGFDGYAVVTGVEEAILNQHVLAGLRVATISVRTVVDHAYAVYDDVLGEQGVDDPKGRVQQCNVLNEDLVALKNVDELGAKGIFRAHDAFLHGQLILIGLHQARATDDALARIAEFPTETG